MSEIFYTIEIVEKHTIFGVNAVAYMFFFAFFAGLLKIVEWLAVILAWIAHLYRRGIDDIVWRRKMSRRYTGRIN